MVEEAVLSSRLVELPVLFIDCQTTGASPERGRVLELGWFVGTAGEELLPGAIKSRLIALPVGEELPVRIERLTGITSEALELAPSQEDVVLELVEDLTIRPVSMVVAHWAQFEQAFLLDLLKNLGSSQFIGSRSIEPLHGLLSSRCFCTCQIAKRLLPDLPSRAIRALCGYFGLTISEEKRAAGHVEATFFIWRKLVERLSVSGVDNLGELSEFLCRPVAKPKAKAKGKPMYELPIDRLKRLELPDSPGIYRMLSSTGKILYVGKATSLRSRVNSYFRGRKKDSKTKELIAQIYDIDIERTETALEACLRETDEIKKHNPPYNRALRERGRRLVFYDRDFSQPGAEQDEKFSLGPFISETLTPLLNLKETLVQKQYDPALFWNLADETVVAEGCALFVADYLNEGEEPSVRSLLALGMAIYRAEVNERLRLLAAQEALSLLPLHEGESADSSDIESGEPEAEDEEEEEESVVDALAIEEMIVGLLVRSARALRQSRRLTALLNSSIAFEDRGVKRLLVVKGGQVEVFTQKSRVKALSKEGGLPWQGLGLDTYDRMRVLSTELARVGALNLRMQISSQDRLAKE